MALKGLRYKVSCGLEHEVLGGNDKDGYEVRVVGPTSGHFGDDGVCGGHPFDIAAPSFYTPGTEADLRSMVDSGYFELVKEADVDG